jgi:hypothetical protein
VTAVNDTVLDPDASVLHGGLHSPAIETALVETDVILNADVAVGKKKKYFVFEFLKLQVAFYNIGCNNVSRCVGYPYKISIYTTVVLEHSHLNGCYNWGS